MNTNNEGLDEILDELDVDDVPTAAYMAYNNAGGAGLVPYLTESKAESNTNVMNEENHSYPLELVRREGHREALREAVQQARERERRRILNKIRDRIDNLRTSNLRPVEVSVIKDKLEELEEEVEGLLPIETRGGKN